MRDVNVSTPDADADAPLPKQTPFEAFGDGGRLPQRPREIRNVLPHQQGWMGIDAFANVKSIDMQHAYRLDVALDVHELEMLRNVLTVEFRRDGEVRIVAKARTGLDGRETNPDDLVRLRVPERGGRMQAVVQARSTRRGRGLSLPHDPLPIEEVFQDGVRDSRFPHGQEHCPAPQRHVPGSLDYPQRRRGIP
eukprot:scaffold869_cov303-Pinguiococcus_pyrenoidosus.AAC.10